ncbi:hypothetical protein ACRRTK_019755 [Alexandromys fortis]
MTTRPHQVLICPQPLELVVSGVAASTLMIHKDWCPEGGGGKAREGREKVPEEIRSVGATCPVLDFLLSERLQHSCAQFSVAAGAWGFRRSADRPVRNCAAHFAQCSPPQGPSHHGRDSGQWNSNLAFPVPLTEPAAQGSGASADLWVSYIGQDCREIPEQLSRDYGHFAKRLDLSFNLLRHQLLSWILTECVCGVGGMEYEGLGKASCLLLPDELCGNLLAYWHASL